MALRLAPDILSRSVTMLLRQLIITIMMVIMMMLSPVISFSTAGDIYQMISPDFSVTFYDLSHNVTVGSVEECAAHSLRQDSVAFGTRSIDDSSSSSLLLCFLTPTLLLMTASPESPALTVYTSKTNFNMSGNLLTPPEVLEDCFIS